MSRRTSTKDITLKDDNTIKQRAPRRLKVKHSHEDTPTITRCQFLKSQNYGYNFLTDQKKKKKDSKFFNNTGWRISPWPASEEASMAWISECDMPFKYDDHMSTLWDYKQFVMLKHHLPNHRAYISHRRPARWRIYMDSNSNKKLQTVGNDENGGRVRNGEC
jgi:hypothetical protein